MLRLRKRLTMAKISITAKRRPIGPQEAPERLPSGPQEAPQRPPRGPQEAPKRPPGGPKEASGSLPAAPKSSKNLGFCGIFFIKALNAELFTKTYVFFQDFRAPGGLPEASLGPPGGLRAPLGGPFGASWGPLGPWGRNGGTSGARRGRKCPKP